MKSLLIIITVFFFLSCGKEYDGLIVKDAKGNVYKLTHSTGDCYFINYVSKDESKSVETLQVTEKKIETCYDIFEREDSILRKQFGKDEEKTKRKYDRLYEDKGKVGWNKFRKLQEKEKEELRLNYIKNRNALLIKYIPIETQAKNVIDYYDIPPNCWHSEAWIAVTYLDVLAKANGIKKPPYVPEHPEFTEDDPEIIVPFCQAYIKWAKEIIKEKK